MRSPLPHVPWEAWEGQCSRLLGRAVPRAAAVQALKGWELGRARFNCAHLGFSDGVICWQVWVSDGLVCGQVWVYCLSMSGAGYNQYGKFVIMPCKYCRVLCIAGQ